MAVRATMARLIERLRRMVGQVEGGGIWSEQQLQDALDDHATMNRYCRLTPVDSFGPGGTRQYLEFISESGQPWESATLYDSSYIPISADAFTFDNRRGIWTFSASRANGILLASGYSYSLEKAAIDLLTEQLGKLRTQVDARDKDTEFKRNQAYKATKDLIETLQANLPMQVISTGRSDVR